MELTHFVSLLTHSGPPANAADVPKFEELIDAALPADYRSFLSQANGGFIPWGKDGPLVLYDGPRYASVAHVFGFREEHHYSLIDNNRDLGVLLPEDLIGIMDDGDGNLICLGISGEVYGEVHVREGGDFYLLAKSFSEFISRLRFVG